MVEGFDSIAVVGCGKDGIGFNYLETIDEGMENVRIAAGVGATRLRDADCDQILVDPMEYPEQAAEGCGLALWKNMFLQGKRYEMPRVELYESTEIEAFARGLFKADAQNLARTLCDAPANQITPTRFAQACVDALCPCGVTIEVRNMDWIESQNMTSFLSVAKSSCEPPIFLELSYCGEPRDEKPILLIGAGMTFNSGGLCLKPVEGMYEYRSAMAGAACVVATMRAAAALNLPINLIGIVPLCENMPSGMAFKPGDVITCLNGKTIAVHDTNNANRLILADTLVYAQEVYKPQLVVDVVTMTTSIRSALGASAAGVFSNSDFMWKQLQKAGSLSGDRVWRMPTWNYYTQQVTGYDNVDLSNRGKSKGAQCCQGAAFIKEFVPCVDWVHLDIAGVGMLKKGRGLPYLQEHRMTGRPTRTLIQFLYQLSCSEGIAKECEEQQLLN
jgi:cytosol aminopeptidase